MEDYSNDKYKVEEKKTFKIFYRILAGAIAIMIIAPVIIHNLSGANDSTRGAFGDMYGVVNALFSGLATGGVILAILLQRLDLKIQRQELKNSIKQLKLQKEEMTLQRLEMQQTTAEIRLQKEILDKQNFEDKFFKLITSFKNSINEIESYAHTIAFTGSQALEKIVFAMKAVQGSNTNERLRKITQEFEVNYGIYYNMLDKYFKELEFIIKFIDSNRNTDLEQNKFYISYIKTILNEADKTLIAFYGLSKHGKNFKELIEKHELILNVRYYKWYTDGTGKEFWSLPYELTNEYPHLKASFDEQRKNQQNS